MRNLIMSSIALALVCASTTHSKEFFTRKESQPLNLPFSEAVRIGDTVYLAGQLGTLPGTLGLAPGGIEAEVRQAIENIEAILNEGYGLGLSDVVKCTAMLADMHDWPRYNKVYLEFFSEPLPVRSSFGSTGLALNARIELECMAAVPSMRP